MLTSFWQKRFQLVAHLVQRRCPAPLHSAAGHSQNDPDLLIRHIHDETQDQDALFCRGQLRKDLRDLLIVNPQLAAVRRKGKAVTGVIFRKAEALQLRVRKIAEQQFPLVLLFQLQQVIHGLIPQHFFTKGVETVRHALTGDIRHRYHPLSVGE